MTLPRGLILLLDDCFYVLVLKKNIIYISCLNRKGFHLTFSNNSYSIMLNGVLHAIGTSYNDLYILDTSTPILIVHDNKRQRQDNLKSSYLWHYHLGHISKRHMSKLQIDGCLGSFDYESYNI